MLAENPSVARQMLARCSAVNIVVGGLETIVGYALKVAIPCPPKPNDDQRASKPYRHRGEDRRTFGTSRDVMPAMAGYTSTPCDHDNYRDRRLS